MIQIESLNAAGPASSLKGRHVARALKAAIALLLRASRVEFAAAIVCNVLGAAALGGLVITVRGLVGTLASGTATSTALARSVPYVIALVLIAALQSSMQAVFSSLMRIVSEQVTNHAVGAVLEVSATVDLAKLDDPDYWDRFQRARSAASTRPLLLAIGIMQTGSAVFALMAVVVALLLISPLLVLLALGSLIPIALVAKGLASSAHRFEFATTAIERSRAYVRELLSDRSVAKDVRALGIGDWLLKRNQSLTDQRMAHLWRVFWRQVRLATFGGVGFAVGLAGLLGGTALLIASGAIPPASVGAAGFALLLLILQAAQVATGIGLLWEHSLFMGDWQSFVALNEGLRADRPTSGVPLTEAPALESVEMETVSFSYPGADGRAVADVCLRVSLGEVVALVGENGSGKTTVAKLLGRLYQPDGGRLLWNGTDVSGFSHEDIRARISVLFQDFARFEFTVEENIGLGNIGDGDDKMGIQRAAERAGADMFIGQLPSGYASVLGNRFVGGCELSVGQWQRLATARSFFRNADLLILDEPTASLDARAEAALYESMRELYRGRAVLLITHRMASARTADRIYVMAQGRLVEEGTHETLMSQKGLYHELFTLQASAYWPDVPTP